MMNSFARPSLTCIKWYIVFICPRKIYICHRFVELLKPWNCVWILRVTLSHNIFFSCAKLWSIFQVLKIRYKSGEMHWPYFNWKTFLLIDLNFNTFNKWMHMNKFEISAVFFLKYSEFFFTIYIYITIFKAYIHATSLPRINSA